MSARRAPAGASPLAWVIGNLFYSVPSSLATLLLVYLAWKAIVPFVDWAFVNAIWSAPDSKPCRDARGVGACWALITEKHRFILFGTYPYEQHWRPALGIGLLLVLYVVSAMRRFWRPALAGLWLAGFVAIGVLMWGGVFGLAYVENERWGGLMLTLLLATVGIAFAFPLSIVLALGRRSDMPAVRMLCVGYIELIRGVPLISLLFMASVMLPLFLPEGLSIDKLLRAQIAMILFAAAYLAEVVRGGLQAVPQGQVRGRRRDGPVVLEEDHAHRAAAGAARLHPAAREHLHRVLQGHLAGGDHRPVRPARPRSRWRSPSRPGPGSASRPTSSLRLCTSPSAMPCRSTARTWSGNWRAAGRTTSGRTDRGRADDRDQGRQQVVRRVPRAEKRRPDGGAGREDRHLRPFGLGQVDAGAPHQPAGSRTRKAASWSTASSSPRT